MNLMSVAWITNNNFKIVFNKTNAEVIDGSVKLTADRVGDLYYVRKNSREHCKIATDTESTSPNTQKTLMSWHRLLGYINFKNFLDAERSGTISEIKIGQRDSRTMRHMHSRKNDEDILSKKIESELLDVIHSDVCGPMRTASNGKAKYFATFIDDKSRWCEIRFLKSKHEVFKYNILKSLSNLSRKSK